MKNNQGFTLIELMVVVLIIGVLASIAYPSYTQYIMRGHRADARTGLLQAQLWMERAATASGVYPLLLPATLTWANDADKRYTIGFAPNNSPIAFTLTAIPKVGPQAQDLCGTLSLTHTGMRSIDNLPVGSPMTVDACWNR